MKFGNTVVRNRTINFRTNYIMNVYKFCLVSNNHYVKFGNTVNIKKLIIFHEISQFALLPHFYFLCSANTLQRSLQQVVQ